MLSMCKVYIANNILDVRLDPDRVGEANNTSNIGLDID